MGDPSSKVSVPRYRQETDPDRKLQRFLVVWAVVFALLSLIVFALTNNAAVLLATTIAGVPISLVYNYYFRR
jgi:hypothetical protein